MTFSWLSHDFLMNFSWLFHDFLMNFSWISHDFLLTFLWLSLDFLITPHEFLMTFSWLLMNFWIGMVCAILAIVLDHSASFLDCQKYFLGSLGNFFGIFKAIFNYITQPSAEWKWTLVSFLTPSLVAGPSFLCLLCITIIPWCCLSYYYCRINLWFNKIIYRTKN